MNEPAPISPMVTVLPAADVTAPPPDTGSVIHRAFPLRQPEEDANEILVSVRGSTLRRVRRRLATLLTTGLPWPETLLGFATLILGASLGAVASGLAWAFPEKAGVTPNARAVLFYVVFPPVGVGAAVAYLFLRHFTLRSASVVAEELLDDLPDPDRTK